MSTFLQANTTDRNHTEITGALENEVFYVQMSRSEPLAPEMSVNTLNNMVVPTIVNASTYTVLEGDHTLLVNYTATGACTITIPTGSDTCVQEAGDKGQRWRCGYQEHHHWHAGDRED